MARSQADPEKCGASEKLVERRTTGTFKFHFCCHDNGNAEAHLLHAVHLSWQHRSFDIAGYQ